MYKDNNILKLKINRKNTHTPKQLKMKRNEGNAEEAHRVDWMEKMGF